MSDTDSFIDEVSEELRRDQMFKHLKRYGWIVGLIIVLIVGGAGYAEYRKSQARGQAQALGDSLLAALSNADDGARRAALDAIDPGTPDAAALVGFLSASESLQSEDTAAAVAQLDAIAVNGDVPQIYRQLAGFKSITLQSDTLSVADRRIAFENIAQPGSPLRLLAEEQLALVDIEDGKNDAAIARYQAILEDAELSQDLQQRALQVIVALGGEPAVRTTSSGADAQTTQTGDN